MKQDIVEIYRDDANEWRWRRRARNGEIVSESGEGYVRRTDVLNEARRQFGETVEYRFTNSAPTPPLDDKDGGLRGD